MAGQNLYLTYKRDTKYLLYWMIHASNNILRKLKKASDGDGVSINSTGQVTVAGLVAMAKHIVAHSTSIPSVVLQLLASVIHARTQAHQIFLQMASNNPDPELERSNISHKHFIDALAEVFQIMGGPAWEKSHKTDQFDQEDVELSILSNQFSALGTDDHDSEDESEPEVSSAPQKRKASKPGKGRKGKGKKKGTRKQPDKPLLDDVPLESYRIIQDFEQEQSGPGTITDYLVATYDLFYTMISLRAETQSFWHEVAYDGLNSAVAGALSNVAIASVKKAESQVFVDFPGNDSFETLFNTITRGNPDKLRDNFSLTLWGKAPEGKAKRMAERTLDIKEQFLFFAYRDLRDFILDYQMNRTGKPTKRMAAETKNWQPTLDLAHATSEERMQWRRAYTINWLYDLVNLFSSIVTQRITLKGEKHDMASIDWSVTGPWSEHRRLYGLNEFAGFVTKMAMQKPGFNVASHILPHHVFQLQCIVDSMIISRGWSIDGLRGDIFSPPAPDYFPRRDVDLFTDRLQKKTSGFLQGEFVAKQLLEKMGLKRGKKDAFFVPMTILEQLKEDFRDWLGETKYMYGLQTIPPSRFSSTSPNGLWEYSPFLCGVGLLEALEQAYLVGIYLMDLLPETTFLIHLHNMLVEEGHLERPVGLWGTIAYMFEEEFFGPGGPPKSNFSAALDRRTQDHAKLAGKQTTRLKLLKTTATIPQFLAHVKSNALFHRKPLSLLLREVDWDPDRVPDEEIQVMSTLAMSRMASTKRVKDPVTGQTKIQETDLVRRAKALGMSEEMIRDTGDRQRALEIPEDLQVPAGAQRRRDTAPDNLSCLEYDILREVCGEPPILGVNYLWVFTVSYALMDTVKQELVKIPRWKSVFDGAVESGRPQPHLVLVQAVLLEQDPEAKRVMADVFERFRGGFWNTYIGRTWMSCRRGSTGRKRTPGRSVF
ncbi:hypothetical protein B0I35DRAFT_434450 [Stachybotrys elegans]|uniref:DUF6604 domain-containing protein n=1 Tax=Stachybotrys elegans TaxID=80388 RepID=A0A8K0WQP3_9HYPO|nr:hypothetical protein B0I35DRAFT_434450 [Stachybotrys elegans]